MPKATLYTLVKARTSFIANVGGEDVLIREGDLADSDAEVVRKFPGQFGPVEPRFPRIEQATAAPGEKRGA